MMGLFAKFFGGMALKQIKALAERGNVAAQSEIGTMYALGEEVVQDYAQAAYWRRKAAEQGNAVAQRKLGAMYAIGQGVPQDTAQAMMWIRKAADQGDADAQNKLAHMLADLDPQNTSAISDAD
ncbi:MAG: tetratricopeptide repeat protein [Gallionella sp.]|nr:tetratricopeptide repeat protein [Gallionella sp.]